jgi:site-specific DNA recombinase
LNVAYCRVSTEEQAAEGFSIDGQAEKLRTYAELHDLGPVAVVEDPGRSGKDLDRPGLQQVLGMVEAGHVQNVLVWRLDRLSRNLGDLIILADRFARAEVGLHSFTEKLDLSSATGRMFYNILGAFAQFYREQLAENVRLGMQQAARQGKWVNRPKMGYDLVDGELVPNGDAPIVQRIFELRSQGASYARIEELTGVKFSTARAIVHSRIYLGEVLLNGEWFPGKHEPLVKMEEFAAAHRGFIPGWRRQSRHVLAGRVRCGLCGRVATVRSGKEGRPLFRCRHRGEGCAQPSRSAVGLVRAALLGLNLVSRDLQLQAAIRRHLARLQMPRKGSRARRRSGGIEALEERRRKLLELYYADRIGAELFAEQEDLLSRRIATLRSQRQKEEAESTRTSQLAERFEGVARLLAEMDIEAIWAEATDKERRVLVEELVEAIAIFPDHLEVTVSGVPRLNVALDEVGLTGGWQFCGVGGGI